MRKAARRHNWFANLLGGRPHPGPGALAHLEASLAALIGEGGSVGVDVCDRRDPRRSRRTMG